MSCRRTGFTVIELIIVIAIVCILASLAVAAYQTYTARSEGIEFAAAGKMPITEAYPFGGVMPANCAASGLSPIASDSRGSYVAAVEIVNGGIDLSFGGPMTHQYIVDAGISITPYAMTNEGIVRRCGNAPEPRGELLTGAAAHEAPSLDIRYLPATCR